MGSQTYAAAIAKRVSPLTYVRPGLPHVFSVHGDQDAVVPYEDSVRLHQALTAVGVPNQLECVSNIDDLDSPAPPPPYFKAFGGYWNATQVFLKHALVTIKERRSRPVLRCSTGGGVRKVARVPARARLVALTKLSARRYSYPLPASVVQDKSRFQGVQVGDTAPINGYSGCKELVGGCN